ncbi:MAG: endonuclease Q family protein, partial [Candidatus Methanomethyliaceae archaeon]|nr:endonuclease Q family protein [Candidatus Methanomethyliaceae archaeon]
MRIVVDLHIHSRYSRATSKDMSFKSLERGAIVKGLDVLGTGDFTHPKWREEIRAALVEEDGLYRLREGGRVRYVVSGEVCTNFEYKGRTRRIHHVLLLPSMEVAEQLIPIFEKRGNLEGDGRPNLSMTGAELVEVVSDLGEDCMVIPAHIWTPWFSLFGARGGVDRIEECYDDQTPHIYALETGLSS